MLNFEPQGLVPFRIWDLHLNKFKFKYHNGVATQILQHFYSWISMEDQYHSNKSESLFPKDDPCKFDSIWFSNFAEEEKHVKSK
jgi:hypothetical protein